MKSLTLIPISLFALLCFSSCKKDYQCTCSIKVSSSTAQLDTTRAFQIDDAKKDEARNRCKDAEDVYRRTYGLFGSVNCNI